MILSQFNKLVTCFSDYKLTIKTGHSPVVIRVMEAGSAPSNDEIIPLPTPVLSKKAQKRLLKKELMAAKKVERRAHQKAMRKEKRNKAKLQSRNDLDSDDEENEIQPKTKRQRVIHPFGACAIIDLGFDDKMSEKACLNLYSFVE